MSSTLQITTSNQFSVKACACGCNKLFTPKNGQQKYLNIQHRNRARQRRYQKAHNVHKEYQGKLFCPVCGKLGSVFLLLRDNGVIMSVIIRHNKRVYSPAKWKALKAQGLSTKQIRKRNLYITKWIHDCYLC